MKENLSVDELHLNGKARHTLRRAGISTCEELLQHNPAALLTLRGVGRGTVEHIREAIATRLGAQYAQEWMNAAIDL